MELVSSIGDSLNLDGLESHLIGKPRIYLRPLNFRYRQNQSVEDIELILCSNGLLRSLSLKKPDLEKWAAGIGGIVQNRIYSLLKNIDRVKSPICGIEVDRPRIMGVVNITPDSFSDGGENYNPEVAINTSLDMTNAGADIIDIGGVSTRPGSRPPSEEEEFARVIPVIKKLKEHHIIVSIDTRRSSIMEAALEAGASIINDISALTADLKSLKFAAKCNAPIILMHMQGVPETMQESPHYDHVSIEIFDYLEARINTCIAAGISKDRLIIDPGVGFGKTVEHNVQLLRDLAIFHGLGCSILIGASRKSFIGSLSNSEQVDNRLSGSISAALHAVSLGAQIVRVHDVAETNQALKVWRELQ